MNDRQMLATGSAAEPPGPPRLFVVYWREDRCRRQLFAFYSEVHAASASEARRGVRGLRHSRGMPRPRVLGVKLRAQSGGYALSGRWVG